MPGNNFSLIWMCGVLESVSFFHNVPPCSGSSVSPWYALTWLAQIGCSPPTPQTFSSADHFASLRPARHRCTTFRMLTCFPRRHVLHDVSCSSRLSLFLSLCFFFFFFLSLAAVSSVRKTGATVKASHCRQMLFSIWHDASSRSHFHCDCRAPSESIDNPCQALAPPTGAGTAS